MLHILFLMIVCRADRGFVNIDTGKKNVLYIRHIAQRPSGLLPELRPSKLRLYRWF